MQRPGPDPAPGPRDAGRPWEVRAQVDSFLDARITPLSDRAKVTFMVLDGRSGMDSFCYPGNRWVCDRTGKATTTLVDIFAELEGLGWILRVFTEDKKKERIGFIMLRRVNPGTPAADTPEKIKAAVEELRVRVSGDPDTGNPASTQLASGRVPGPRYRKSGITDTGNPAAYLSTHSEEDSGKDNDASSSSSEGLRPGEGEARTDEAVSADPVQYAIVDVDGNRLDVSYEWVSRLDANYAITICDDAKVIVGRCDGRPVVPPPTVPGPAGRESPSSAGALGPLMDQAGRSFSRPGVAAMVKDAIPGWHAWLDPLTPRAVAWIAEGIANASGKRDLGDAVAFIRKCLSNWVAEGRPAREAGANGKPIGTAGGGRAVEPAAVTAQERARIAADGEANMVKDADRKARWAALAAADRAEIEASIRGKPENSGLPMMMLEASCLIEMDRRASPPCPEPAPPARPKPTGSRWTEGINKFNK